MKRREVKEVPGEAGRKQKRMASVENALLLSVSPEDDCGSSRFTCNLCIYHHRYCSYWDYTKFPLHERRLHCCGIKNSFFFQVLFRVSRDEDFHPIHPKSELKKNNKML